MKFLILGCNGMAGNTIAIYLQEMGHNVIGFARKKSKYFETVIGDAFDTNIISQFLNDNTIDSVINCIGMLNQFAENDKASASFLNSYLPHYLAKITEKKDTQIIHMSTDCVFSGKRGGYSESDFPDGETFYDRSKALGELNDFKNITLRNSIVGPDINQNGIGLLNWFMKQNGEVNGFTKSLWTGQTTLQLAKTMEQAATQRAFGLYNAVPDKSISKFELLKLFNFYFKNGQLKINPVDGVCADKSLIRKNYDFSYLIPDYDIMISELAEWMNKHKDLYPHYNL